MAANRVTPTVIALFGAGRIGQIRLRNIVKNDSIELKYVVDISKQFAKEQCQKLHLSSVIALDLTEINVVIDDDEVSGIFICTPTPSHEEILTKGLNAGKHVFCEKPLSTSYEITKKCCKLAKERGRILHCSFQRRFDPSFREVYNRSGKGEVGQVTMIRTISRDPQPPTDKIMREADCTIFFDSAIHDIDVVCWLAREWPTSVYAVGHAWSKLCKDLSDCDVVNITLKFPSGIIGNVEVNRYSPSGYDQRIEVTGIDGTLRVHNRPENCVELSTKNGHISSKDVDFFLERYPEAFQLSTNHFLKAMNGIVENEVNEETIVNVMKVASLCEQSWKSGIQVTFEKEELV